MSSVWNICRWDAGVPPRKRFPAARSEEKRLFSQASVRSTSLKSKVRLKLAEKGKESVQSFQGHPLRISKPRIPDSRNNNLPDSGIWILLLGWFLTQAVIHSSLEWQEVWGKNKKKKRKKERKHVNSATFRHRSSFLTFSGNLNLARAHA